MFLISFFLSGDERDPLPEKIVLKKLQLPQDFATVNVQYVNVKASKCAIRPELELPNDLDALNNEIGWLRQCLDVSNANPWGAYQGKKEELQTRVKTNIAFLPVFHEQAHSPSTMAHCMKVLAKSTNFLNPGQTPVMVVDQPLYAMCKQLQWLGIENFNEENFFILFGTMHIEQAGLKLAGQWLDGSGWTSALTEAKVATSGRADAAVKVCHLTRARYAHQVWF